MELILTTESQIQDYYFGRLTSLADKFGKFNEMVKWIGNRRISELRIAEDFLTGDYVMLCVMCGSSSIPDWPDNDICPECKDHSNPSFEIEELDEYISEKKKEKVL